jgi:hypothetical protein
VSERGEISLTGLLVAMTIFMAVLGATLTTFEAFDSQAAGITRRTDAQDAARRAADRIARDLRNLAGPTQFLPEAVDLAGPSDLVFNVVDDVKPAGSLNKANVKRVRYCLDAPRGVIWQQEQRWTQASRPAMPETSGCPAAAWGAATQVSANVTNSTRPIFTYDTTVRTSISSVGVDLFVDDQAAPARPRRRSRLASSCATRTGCRSPASRPTTTSQGVLLNGSASTDPEGQPLDFEWFNGTQKIGEGVTFLYAVPSGGSNAFSLRVSDPAGLAATSSSPQVNP